MDDTAKITISSMKLNSNSYTVIIHLKLSSKRNQEAGPNHRHDFAAEQATAMDIDNASKNSHNEYIFTDSFQIQFQPAQ